MFMLFNLLSAKCTSYAYALKERLRSQQGAATAEYAIVVMAAIALAGVLLLVVKSGGVKSVIEGLVINAFKAPK